MDLQLAVHSSRTGYGVNFMFSLLPVSPYSVDSLRHDWSKNHLHWWWLVHTFSAYVQRPIRFHRKTRLNLPVLVYSVPDQLRGEGNAGPLRPSSPHASRGMAAGGLHTLELCVWCVPTGT